MQHVPSASVTMCEGGSVPLGPVTPLREHILTGPEEIRPPQTERVGADLQDSNSPKTPQGQGYSLSLLPLASIALPLPTMLPEPHAPMLPFI